MSKKRSFSTVVVVGIVALFLGFAASASAQSPGLDQYTESIPGAGGNRTTDNGDGGNGGGGDGGGSSNSAPAPSLDSSQLDALRAQGEDGERAAAALEATSGRSNSNGDGDGSNGLGGSQSGSSSSALSDEQKFDSAEADGKAPLEAVVSSMLGGGGGIGLPLVLLAVLIGGLVLAARKRAKAGPTDD